MIKNISNSFIGGFFRRLGSIFALFFILAFIGYLLKDLDSDSFVNKLLGLQKINASTQIIPSTYKHKLIINEYNNGIINRQIDSGWFEGNYTNFCSSGMTCGLDYDYYYITLPSSLDSGRSYNLTFNTWVTTRPSQNYANKIEYYMLASNSGSYSGASTSSITSFSCKVGIEEGTTSKLNFSCLFTPSTQINYIYLRMSFPNNTGMSGFTPFTSFGSNKGSISYDNAQVDAINQQTQIIQQGNSQIIDNNNSNTQNIIDNNNSNTQNIIDSQNELLGSKCSNEYNGNITSSNQNLGKFKSNTKYYLSFKGSITGYNIRAGSGGTLLAYCTSNKCEFTTDNTGNLFFNGWGLSGSLTDVMLSQTSYSYCKYGSINSKLDDTNKSINDINNSLSSSNTSEAETEAEDLFTNTQYETHGITGIITAPLNLIESLVSKSCSPLVLPLPFVDEDLTLPCLSSIYSQNFPNFLLIYQIIISALIGYRICVSVFFMVKDFKNPDSDKIEVLDL